LRRRRRARRGEQAFAGRVSRLLPAYVVSIRSVEDAMHVCRGLYPDEEISTRSRAVLEELFG
jgi:hypothetical protein